MSWRRRVGPAIALVLVVAPVAGCTGTSAPGPTSAAPTGPSAAQASDSAGSDVDVLGLWSGPELDSFLTVKAAWEADTGSTVAWDGTTDLAGELTSRIESGDAPDIAVLPNPGLMQQLAEEGLLVPLDSFLDMEQIAQDYAPPWIELGSYDGSLYGILYKVANKSTVWFNPPAFAGAGYAVPKTWDDMVVLADEMVAGGLAPFSVVAPRSPGAGWALTDWISEIVLNRCGPDVYDQWIAAEIPWTHECIKQSFDMFVDIVETPGYVLGGTQGILGTTDAEGTYPLYTDPPTAYMYYLASFAQAFIAEEFPDLDPGDDYDVFPFPTIDPQHAGAVTVGADVVVMVNDTPAARSFMTYLAGAEAQEAWIELGGFTSVNRSVPPDAYGDPVARAVAEQLTTAKVSRFGAGDMMPAQVQRAWWQGMLDLVQDPSTVDSLLAAMTDVARVAASGGP